MIIYGTMIIHGTFFIIINLQEYIRLKPVHPDHYKLVIYINDVFVVVIKMSFNHSYSIILAALLVFRYKIINLFLTDM